MRKYFWPIFGLVIVLLCSFIGFVFAETPIYCPQEKILLYYYQKEMTPNTPVKAEDFKPANDLIPQPSENSPMVCPLCGSPLNGYEWFIWSKRMQPIKLVYLGFTLLTKDKDGNFRFIPYEFAPEDWEGKY